MPRRDRGVYLREGSNVYQWRIKIPKDLLGHPEFAGKNTYAVRESLGKTDLREANAEAAARKAKVLAWFQHLRHPQVASVAPDAVEVITPEVWQMLVDL